MNKNVILPAVMALLIGATWMVADAGAGGCYFAKCTYDTAQVDIQIQGQPGGGWGDGYFRKRFRRRPPIYDLPSPNYGNNLPPAQSYDPQDNGGALIGPTQALNQALNVVPGGTALGVKLLRGPTPVYSVKMRVGGQVLRVIIDARTAQVLGQ